MVFTFLWYLCINANQSLMTEHGIKGLANILMTYLKGTGDNWSLYCKPSYVGV